MNEWDGECIYIEVFGSEEIEVVERRFWFCILRNGLAGTIDDILR